MKQNKIKAQAEKDADAAMKAARKSLEKNYMDSLAIQKEPYELEREAMLSAGAQATEAARESERGAGRVGAIYAQQQQGQRQIASAMGQEMFNLDYLSTQEDTRLRDLNTQLDLGEVEGAQLQAANAEERRQQQLMAGAQGIGNAAATGLDALDLYKKQKIAPSTASAPFSMDNLDQYNIFDYGQNYNLGQTRRGLFNPTNTNTPQYSLFNQNKYNGIGSGIDFMQPMNTPSSYINPVTGKPF